MATTQMTGGEAVVATLKQLGVKHVFGIPSVHNLPIFDAIDRDGSIKPVIVRHEQAAVHSADGYARATGEIGVALASTGPGTTNTVTGLYEAAFASSRALLITGQVDAVFYGKGKGPGHQADNQVAMLQSVVPHVESVRHTQEIPLAIHRAVQVMHSGQPQPAAIEIPIDLQYAYCDIDVPEFHAPAAFAGLHGVDAAVELLAESNKRIIIAGGGAQDRTAPAAVTALAEALNAPVFTSGNGRGAIADDHDLAMGVTFNTGPVQQAIADADVVLAVGTWFHGGAAMWNANMPGKLIHVDINPHAHGLVFPAEVSIIGDAGASLEAISERLNAEPGDDSFVEQVRSARDKVQAGIKERIGKDQAGIMDHMRRRMSREDVFVRDMTVPAYTWGNQLFPILAPRTTMNPTSGAIGPGLPMANGAAMATGRKTVVMHGDGGFMLHVGELATTAQYQIPLVICIFNDSGYGVLRRIQGNTFNNTVGVDLATPDFAALAQSFGIHGEHVRSLEEFEDAFDRAMDAKGPVLLDIDQNSLIPIEFEPRQNYATRPQA